MNTRKRDRKQYKEEEEDNVVAADDDDGVAEPAKKKAKKEAKPKSVSLKQSYKKNKTDAEKGFKSHIDKLVAGMGSDTTDKADTSKVALLASAPAPGLVASSKPLFPHIEELTQQFLNWGQTVSRAPSRWFRPKTKSDLFDILKKAFETKKTQKDLNVRVSACKHSWSDIFVDDGDWLIDMSNYKKKMALITHDPTIKVKGFKGTVEISPSVTTGDLMTYFLNNDCCIKSDVILETVYYAGVVATGCHGTGGDEKTVSDYIVRMKIMQCNSQGVIEEVTYKDPTFYSDSKNTAEEFNYVRANLGLFGIISEMTLKVYNQINVMVNNSKPMVKEYFPKDHNDTSNTALRDLVKSKQAVEVFWFPFSGFIPSGKVMLEKLSDLKKLGTYDPFVQDMLWVKTFEPTDEEPSVIGDIFEPILTPVKNMFDYLRTKMADIAMGDVASKVSSLTPLLGWAAAKSLPVGSSVERMVNAIHYQMFIDNFQVRDIEFCYKCDANFINIRQAVNIAMNMIREWHEKDKYPINVALEFRFVRGSDVLLAPAYSADKNDYFCYIEVLTAIENKEWMPFIFELSKAWTKVPGFVVPHWAKEFPPIVEPTKDGKLTEDAKKKNVAYHKELIEKAYGSRLDGFRALRKKNDPHGMFGNKWLTQVLGL